MLVGRHGGEGGEVELGAALLDIEAVDLLDELHLRIGKLALGGIGGAGDQAALAELEAAYQLLGHKDVGGAALAEFGAVEELAVAALREIDVEAAVTAAGAGAELFSIE
jgi:hypothetical protein